MNFGQVIGRGKPDGDRRGICKAVWGRHRKLPSLGGPCEGNLNRLAEPSRAAFSGFVSVVKRCPAAYVAQVQ
jgi:hypothetical protein